MTLASTVFYILTGLLPFWPEIPLFPKAFERLLDRPDMQQLKANRFSLFSVARIQ
jgi:hypothetical protein